MKTIDVGGLPEPIAEAVARMVDALREQYVNEPQKRQKVKLITRPGKVYGRLTREEIYDDVV